MPHRYQPWIEQIKHLCGAANQRHIDVVVDQAACDLPILPALDVIEPHIPWFSLFSGTPEEALLDHAPILMRISLDDWRHTHWLEQVIEHFGASPCLLLLISPMPFNAFARRLQAMSQLEWGGQSGLLRFYDPRVLPQLLANVLNDEQREKLLQLALFFSWLDRDQCPIWQPGTYRLDQVPVTTPLPIALNDAQFDQLGCISDAHQLMRIARAKLPALSQEQCFARCYQIAMKAAMESYFGDLKVYAELELVKIFSRNKGCGHGE